MSSKINFEDIIKSKILYDFNNDLSPSFKDKTVLITGAGGSIGSQLCKEIIKYEISTIILLDHAEYNLFEIAILNTSGDFITEKFVEGADQVIGWQSREDLNKLIIEIETKITDNI